MSFEDIQQQWQHQNQRPHPKVDADLLLQEVRRNQRSFQAAIFWRDFREVVAAVFVVIFFILRGRDWTHHLLAVAGAGVGIFILVDRLRQRLHRPSQDENLKIFVEQSLQQWKHQIWLLKNVIWWYLLPITLPLLISFSVGASNVPQAARQCSFTLLLMGFIYWLNRNVVKKYLIPRSLELEKLLAGISETGGENESASHASNNLSNGTR
jgi:hypothetical protein